MLSCVLGAYLALMSADDPTTASDHPTFAVFTQQMTLQISSSETGGAFSVLRILAPPGGGPAAHIHTREDETYVITRGKFRFWHGAKVVDAKEGDTVFMPRGEPHQWRNVGTEPGETILTIYPSGLEKMFMEISRRKLRAPNDHDQITELQREYGIESTTTLIR